MKNQSKSTEIHVGFFYNKEKDKYWGRKIAKETDFKDALILEQEEVDKELISQSWRKYLEVPDSFELVHAYIPLNIDSLQVLTIHANS